MNLKHFFEVFIFAFLLVSCTEAKGHKVNKTRNNIEIETEGNLVIYYPLYDYIDHACGTMPSKKDSSVIFCCSASFTGELLKTFKHSNIAGNHVSSGVFHRGFKCKPNTGCFTFYDGRWNFYMDNRKEHIKEAAANKGMAFEQNMIIFNGKMQPSFRKLSSLNKYRALCEYNNRLCIIDSRWYVSYKTFRNSLKKLNVKNALYLDMGKGWNHSWYRDNDGKVEEIHPRTQNYLTNWIVFKTNN